MATKQSGAKKTKRSSLFSRLVTGIWIVVSGGGLLGWATPEFRSSNPFVARIVKMLPWSDATDHQTGEGLEQLQTRIAGSDGMGTVSNPPGGSTGLATAPAPTSRKSAESILIASFNIQVFGESKLGKAGVVDVLAQVVRQFDVVAIQEIRAKSDDIIPRFLQQINADGSRYAYVIGPRLGRTVSTEQYAFLYDTMRIEIDTSSPGTIQDPNDRMHREPYVTRFRARSANPAGAFSFWLINAHTDPDEVPIEVDTLADVFLVMQQARVDEDDVILLGDLNASDSQFGRLGQIPNMTWAVRGTTTNTRRSKMYDNILFDRYRTQEFTGRWGVYDLESTFQLTREQALTVSDHLPVWAEFSIQEAPAASRAALPIGTTAR